MLEPTAAEIVTMKSLSDVTQWLQVPSHLADAWFEKLGATGKDSPSIVGMLSHEEVDAEVATIRIDERPLSLLQKGLLRASLHVCQLVAGMVQSSAAPAPSVPVQEPRSEVPGPTPTPGISGPQVALKQVISQGSEETVPKLSPQDLSLHWDRFKEVFGRDPRPEEECTGDQLTGVDLLLKRDCVPYVDFGVWGPNHGRLLKKLRTTGLQLHAGGVLKNVELSGPPDVDTWTESYKLLCTALIGFRAVSLGPLMDYARLTTGYATRYGTATWPLLYQSDVRCRLEHMERLRRVLERDSAAAKARGQAPATPFDPSQPWNSVWVAAVDDTKFWHHQFEEPALLILTRAGRLSDVITGEAPVERSHPSQSVSAPAGSDNAKRRRIERPRRISRKSIEKQTVCTHTTDVGSRFAVTSRPVLVQRAPVEPRARAMVTLRTNAISVSEMGMAEPLAA